MPINETAVHSILATGGGYSQLREFSAGVGIHCMSKQTFLKHMKKVSEAIDDASLQSMLDAAEEEKAITIRDGNVDSVGVPMCTVADDGAWCKQSYKTNYDSLSGAYLAQNLLYFCMDRFCFQASIFGFKTVKVLYIRCYKSVLFYLCVMSKCKANTTKTHMFS
ncbi:hypothetical protein PR048_007840 [Dryococelus australis]|uniref:Mutator-like transposase domain-containing protein n=1 Tax=Dryococelus australis TaxID=614101 RepID=A0ABQ9HVJ9_9NEOP|nr:hypothetical protein PR048_007840 [Dryococelus australis]